MPAPNSQNYNPPPTKLLKALSHPWVWRMAWRDGRSERKRLSVFALAIVSGVAALTAIHCVKVSVEAAVDVQAKALLGADLQISSREAYETADTEFISSKAESLSREVAFSSMLFFPEADAAKLVQVRGVDGKFPFYGDIETKPSAAWQLIQQQRGVVLEASLMDQFGLKTGDTVKLGELNLTILGVVTKPAPRSSRFSGIAPEIYLNLNELEATGLLGTSSLSFHTLYLKNNNAEQIKELRTTYASKGWRFETPEDRRDSLGKTLDVFQQFLGIIAMVALILGAIGVASAIQTHLNRRISSIAILRCLGCPGQTAYAVYLVQSLALGVLGALSGGMLGILLHVSLLHIFKDQLPITIEASPQWLTAFTTTAIGFAVCTAFTFLPLSRISSISPGRALNNFTAQGFKQQGRSLLAVGSFLFIMLLILAWFNIPDPKRAAGMVVGLAIVLACLGGTARLLIFLARRLTRRSWPYLLRQGLSNLHRPQNQTHLFLFSLGLGAFLLLFILLAKNAALERITLSDMKDSPNIYLVDVQAGQLEGVTTLVKKLDLPVLERAPIVTMRIKSIKGVAVRELQEKGKVPRWILQREFRSSYRDNLSNTETVVAGEWSTNYDKMLTTVPVSLEVDMAKDLGVILGDELEIDIQGVLIQAKIASLRKVDWSRFNLNFFMLFPSDVLKDAPGFHIVTTRIPEGSSSGQLQRELVKQFPNVSAIDLTLILETVNSILQKVSLVIQFVVGFTLASGLAILAGTLLNGRDQRLRESALLRTLGASTRQIQSILVVEYAALGFFSGLTGVLLALTAYIPLSIWVFESSAWPGVFLPLLVIAATTLLSVLAGLVLSRGVCRHSPLEVINSA